MTCHRNSRSNRQARGKGLAPKNLSLRIERLRAQWPEYKWRYVLVRKFEDVRPTYVASAVGLKRTVAWFAVDGYADWRWTDSRETVLPALAGAPERP